MGNTCGTSKKSTKDKSSHEEAQGHKIQKSNEEVKTEFQATDFRLLSNQERRAQLEHWLSDVQIHNRERLRKEMLTDLHTFILNNVLLCVQFYANFDSSMSAAKEFKKITEMRMAEKLVSINEEGMILGNRKCTLVHAMGQQLLQNYIYRDDGFLYKEKQRISGGSDRRKKQVTISATPDNINGDPDDHGPRGTFISDSIIPLEFYITWENLQVYKESEWNDVKDMENFATKGLSRICRVCMEETDEKNKIPRGFVRVRVADKSVPVGSFSPPILPTTLSVSPPDSVGYAAVSSITAAGTEFEEPIYDITSESDVSTSSSSYSSSNSSSSTGSPSSNESDDDQSETNHYASAFARGKNFMTSINRRDSNSTSQQKFIVPKPPPPPPSEFTKLSDESSSVTSTELSTSTKKALRNPVVIPSSYQEVITELSRRQQGNFPELKATPLPPPPPAPIITEPLATKPPKPTATKSPKKAKSKPPATKTSPRVHRKASLSQTPPPMTKFLKTSTSVRSKSLSLPPLAPPPPPPPPIPSVQHSSSGYDSNPVLIPPPPITRTRFSISTSNSDEIQLQWQQSELKRLWQFMPKKRTKAVDPLSASCFQKIQIEVESSDDELELVRNPDSDTDDSISDSASDTLSSNRKRVKANLHEPKYEDRTYLNSVGFSGDFCSEFKQVGGQLGVDEGALRTAVILGITIRCAIPQLMGASTCIVKPTSTTYQNGISTTAIEPISKLCTFTPCLQSKHWPQKSLIWWQQRVLRHSLESTEKWPTTEQLEQIEDSGCYLIPLGNRSLQSTQTENVQQTLVWSVAFPKAETILLDSLLHVQWRCLTASALIFRAFLAPLGPLGIGLEHFRNILYFMCQEEFLSWNYEQPGLHLQGVLDRLYDCLGRGDMPSFFVVGHNLLENIPKQNLRKVQAYLSRVRTNLTVHAIYMVRNLVQVNTDFYLMPKDNFKLLYDYMTVPEKQILYMVNPLLAGITTEDVKHQDKKQKKRQQKEINQTLLANGELIDNAYGQVMNKSPPQYRAVDHEQRKFRRQHERWLEKQQKIKLYEAEQIRREAESHKLPQEKKNVIDLNEKPIKQRQFSAQRLGLIIKYFIKHFIKMAAKSYQFKSYAQASMYTQHVENLISLLQDLPNEAESEDTQKFQEDANILRATIGIQMTDYIQEKIAHVDEPTGAGGRRSTKIFNQISGMIARTSTRQFSTNWDLRTARPTPPASYIGPTANSHAPSRTRGSFDNTSMAQTLASMPMHPARGDELRVPRFRVGGDNNYRRGPDIKWNSSPAFPPNMSPRMLSTSPGNMSYSTSPAKHL